MNRTLSDDHIRALIVNPTPERLARYKIKELLEDACWEVQDRKEIDV